MSSPETSFLDGFRNVAEVKPTAPTSKSDVEVSLGEADLYRPITIKNIFTHPEAHPIVLCLVLMKVFGHAWIDWEITTIWAEITKTFQTQISEHNRVKIMCVKTLLSVDSPWNQWQVFEKIIQGLNNNIPQFEIMQAPSLEELFAGVDMINTLIAPKVKEFSSEVINYASAAVLLEELTFVPSPLEFLQPTVTQPYFECTHCGKQERLDESDGICSSCSKRYSEEGSLNLQPKELTKGEDTVLQLKYPYKHIADEWEVVKHLPSEQYHMREDNGSIQIAKLLMARDYTNIRRTQLVNQITSLRSYLETP